MLPVFYRTWWFLALAISSASALAWLFWWRRQLRIQKAHLALQAFSRELIESQERERQRIAAELHDSLGQRLVLIKNRALLFLRAPADSTAIGQIEQISVETSNAIGEVKEIAHNLRPYQLDRIGLTRAIEGISRDAQSASEIEFQSEIDDIDGLFPQDSQINFYRIVQEGISNVIKHSKAARASVVVTCEEDRVLLSIRDDGQGFATSPADTNGNRCFGLIGIAERAELLGGKATIQSAPAQGTTVTVVILRTTSRRGHLQ